MKNKKKNKNKNKMDVMKVLKGKWKNKIAEMIRSCCKNGMASLSHRRILCVTP